MELAGRVAIVTGGGTGIGRATALRLAKSGAKAVVVNYSRSAAEAETTAKDVTALGAEAITHRSDVADEAQVKGLVASTVDRYGRLDVLVNNAGTTHFIPHPDLDALTDAELQRIVREKLVGARTPNGDGPANGGQQKVVPLTAVETYLEQGWAWVTQLPDDRAVVRFSD